ncbi:tape measure protein [Chitinophaga sp. 22536]|uniref:tape measure protein n=1 Tax=unclassified Chitinophaga TaxID=2619133 RepID=UPI003F83DECB
MSETVSYILTLRDLISNQLRNVDSTAKKVEGTMNDLQSTINKVGAGMGLAFGLNEVRKFAMDVVDAGSKVENARTGLTTMLRDSNAAAEVIQNTMEDAMKTPFAFDGLLNANKILISASVSAKDARATVLDLANAIAATGGGDDELNRMVVNLQQIKNVGVASAMDIKQFALAGINIYGILAAATGKHTEQVKDMDISYNMLTNALKKAHEQGGIYANGLENMAGNTSVQISNLGDALFQLKVKMFDDLKPAIDAIVGSMSGFIESMRSTWDWLVQHKRLVKDFGSILFVAAGGWLAYKTMMFGALLITKASLFWEGLQYASIVLLGDGMLTASAATKAWAGMQVLLNQAFAANPIGFIITAIAAVTAAVIYCYNHFAKFRAFIWATWGVLKEFASIVSDVFAGLYRGLKGLFNFDWNEYMAGSKQMADAMFNSAKRIGEAAKKGWDAGLADFAKDNPEEAKSGTPKTVAAAGAGGTGMTAPVANKTDTGASKVTGSKSYTINIKIDNLIREFTVKTTNIAEGAGKVKELVTQALLSAVNDSQIVAGQ